MRAFVLAFTVLFFGLVQSQFDGCTVPPTFVRISGTNTGIIRRVHPNTGFNEVSTDLTTEVVASGLGASPHSAVYDPERHKTYITFVNGISTGGVNNLARLHPTTHAVLDYTAVSVPTSPSGFSVGSLRMLVRNPSDLSWYGIWQRTSTTDGWIAPVDMTTLVSGAAVQLLPVVNVPSLTCAFDNNNLIWCVSIVNSNRFRINPTTGGTTSMGVVTSLLADV